MLNENDITDILADYFVKQNYEIDQKLHTVKRGVDLIVKDSKGVKHYIEVKGETSSKHYTKRYGLAFDRKQIWNHISVALMKTIVTMADEASDNHRYGMAFPSNHEPLLLRILPALIKLNISIYIVSKESVKVLA